METSTKPKPGPISLASWLRAGAACAALAGFTLGCSGGTNSASAPTVTSFSPTAGVFSSTSPTLVTVTGTNFASNVHDISVFVGSVLTDNGVLISDTSFQFTVPAAASSAPIQVTTNGGTTQSLASFIVIPTPATLTTTPPSGNQPSAQVGSLVTITGYGLQGVSEITMNASGGGQVHIIPSNSTTANLLTFTIPANAATVPNPTTLLNNYGRTADVPAWTTSITVTP